MTPGGARRANNRGHVKTKALCTGELRYLAYWRARYLGSYETRAQAERAIRAAQGEGLP